MSQEAIAFLLTGAVILFANLAAAALEGAAVVFGWLVDAIRAEIETNTTGSEASTNDYLP